MRQLRVLSGAATLCAAFLVNQPVEAGFGLFGSHGGHGSYGSSGGYAVGVGYGGSSGGYGSSGAYAAAYSGGSSGGYVAAYGSSGGGYAAAYGSSGGLGSSGTAHVGPIKRLAARIHAHHAAKVAARGSSGGYGSSGAVAVYSSSYGSSGGSSGGVSYGSSGGSSGGVSYGSSGGSSGGYSVSSAPAVTSYHGGSSGYAAAAPAYHSYESYSPVMQSEVIIEDGMDTGVVVEPAETVVDPAAEASIESDAALLTIAVPESATVVVNGLETTSRGEVRQFMSNGLKEGFVYTYVVEVNFADGSEPASKTVKLRAGATERLVFNETKSTQETVSAAAIAPETVVTLRVPADAKVNLAGNDTTGSGDVRTFRTRQLAEGQKWDGYTISVTASVNGQDITKEKTIDLVAGSELEFTFDFADASLASR